MGVSKKNPFEVFGLNPEIVEVLDEKDLFDLIKSMYRTLLKICHPDRGYLKKGHSIKSDSTNVVELNLAFERLDITKSPDSFRRCRRSYRVRKNKGLLKRIEALESGIKQNKDKKNALADGFMTYLLRGLPWLPDNGCESGRPHLALANIKLGLNDVAINQNLRTVSWNMGSNYKEIIFDSLGDMYYRPVGRTKAFPVNFIHVLGTVETSTIDLMPLLDRVTPREGIFKSPALDSRYGIDGAPLQVQNTITMEKFKKYCLPVLRPELKEKAYLFAINRPIFEAEARVSLEGVIVKISKL